MAPEISERWLRAFLEEGQPVEKLGSLLLQPSAVAPSGFVGRGKIVCSCFGVSEREIDAALAAAGADRSLEYLQQKLKCGTNCGSCIPELKHKVALTVARARVKAAGQGDAHTLHAPRREEQTAIDACVTRCRAVIPLFLAGEFAKATGQLHRDNPA